MITFQIFQFVCINATMYNWQDTILPNVLSSCTCAIKLISSYTSLFIGGAEESGSISGNPIFYAHWTFTLNLKNILIHTKLLLRRWPPTDTPPDSVFRILCQALTSTVSPLPSANMFGTHIHPPINGTRRHCEAPNWCLILQMNLKS